MKRVLITICSWLGWATKFVAAAALDVSIALLVSMVFYIAFNYWVSLIVGLCVVVHFSPGWDKLMGKKQ